MVTAKIVANEHAGETEKMYNGVTVIVIPEEYPDPKVKMRLVRPMVNKCSLVKEIYVLKSCLVFQTL